MNPKCIAALLGASLLTAIAVIGSIDRWHSAAAFLHTAAVGAWIVFAVASGTDRIVDAITQLRADVDTYGDQRHSDGVIDGMNRVVPPQSTLRGLR